MSYFNTRFTKNHNREKVWAIFAPYLKKKFFLSGPILDVGSGYGEFIRHVGEGEKWALDLEPTLASHYADFGIRFVASPAGDLGSHLPKDYFGTIFSSNLLEHLSREEIMRFLQGARQCLQPNGKLVIFMPNFKRAFREYYDDYTHTTALTEVSLSDMIASSGFQVEFVHPGFMPYSVKDSRLPVNKILVWLWLSLPFKFFGKQMLVVARKSI